LQGYFCLTTFQTVPRRFSIKTFTYPSRFQQESMMGEFDAIRPYDDSEVPAVLARLLGDKAFLDILTHFRFPRFAGAFGWMLKPLIAHRLRREFAGVTSVATLQDKVECTSTTPSSAPPTA
jgi:hypothetical protein